jgi:hypothetical protein
MDALIGRAWTARRHGPGVTQARFLGSGEWPDTGQDIEAYALLDVSRLALFDAGQHNPTASLSRRKEIGCAGAASYCTYAWA